MSPKLPPKKKIHLKNTVKIFQEKKSENGKQDLPNQTSTLHKAERHNSRGKSYKYALVLLSGNAFECGFDMCQ